MISRHNFWSITCEVFTCLLIGKVLLEGVTGHRDAYYVENILTMLGITVLATLILSIHKYMQNMPVIFVMILQYVVLISCVMGGIWLGDFFTEVSPDGYRDMFWTVTIPYVVLAGMYYISFFWEIKKANALLQEINVPGEDKKKM